MLKRAASLDYCKTTSSFGPFLRDKFSPQNPIAWNDCPGFFPVKNGTINLRTAKLLPPDPRHHFSQYCSISWPERGLDEPRPLWEQFHLDTHEGDQDTAKYRSLILPAPTPFSLQL